MDRPADIGGLWRTIADNFRQLPSRDPRIVYNIASNGVGSSYNVRYGSFLYFGILLYIDIIYARSLFGVLYTYD